MVHWLSSDGSVLEEVHWGHAEDTGVGRWDLGVSR